MNTRSLTKYILAAAVILALCSSSGQGLAALDAGSPAPSLWVTPLVLDFGPVGLGQMSVPQAVTINNTGNTTLTDFFGGWVDAPFSMFQSCGGGVPLGGSCQYFFKFSPTEKGVFTATSSTSTNAGPFIIELRGEGVGPELHVNPLALDYGLVPVGNSASQAVTLHNTGLSKLNYYMGVYEPPFGSGAFCTQGILPGESCDFYIHFSPTQAGIFTAKVDFTSDAGPFSIDLMGRGRSDAFEFGQRVTPRALDFGPVGVGLNAPALEVTITNQSLFQTIMQWTIGAVSIPFGSAQNCTGGVPPNESCQISYTFNPTETGVFTASHYVSNSYGAFTIQLRGEGAGAEFTASPLRLDLGSVIPGNSSAMQNVTVKNIGLSTLTDFAGGGMVPPFQGYTSCAAGVLPGGTCQLGYVFAPTEWGRYSATSYVNTNAGVITIAMSGGLELPSLGMVFEPDWISTAGISTLYYSIYNPNPTATLFEVSLENALPSGMLPVLPLTPYIAPDCGTPTVNYDVTSNDIDVTSATLLGSANCWISVTVTAANIGQHENTAGPVKSTTGWGNSASATLHVGTIMYLPLVTH